MKKIIYGYCKKCKNKSFRFEKKIEDEITEVLGHDGFGWDLNTFDIICSKCEGRNTDVFEIKKGSTAK